MSNRTVDVEVHYTLYLPEKELAREIGTAEELGHKYGNPDLKPNQSDCFNSLSKIGQERDSNPCQTLTYK